MASITFRITLRYNVNVGKLPLDTLAVRAQELAKYTPEKLMGRKLPSGVEDWEVAIDWINLEPEAYS